MSQNSETQLVPTIPVEGTKIEIYGERDHVRELMERLMMFHPAAADVGKIGMLAAAQLAILLGASPLPSTNEIHIWRNKKRNTLHAEPGINFWRRRRDELGGLLWLTRPTRMNKEEMELYGIPQGVETAVCRAVKRDDLREWLAAGFDKDEVIEMCMEFGIGIVGQGEEPKKGRPLFWTALKRCETDLLKKLFPLRPGENLQPGLGLKRTDNAYAMDDGPAWREIDLSAPRAPNPELEQMSIEEIRDSLF